MGMFHANGFRWRQAPHPTPMSTDDPGGIPPESRVDLSAGKPIWILYASETGAAEDLAHDTIRRLRKAGRLTRLVPLDTVDMQSLVNVDQALFLASTCGDGEPPFMGDAFEQQYMRSAASLPKLQYGLLALGDRRYDDYCAFGRQLHQWLRSSGARALFEPVEMDDEDASALRRWHDSLRMPATRVGTHAGTSS